MPMRTVELTDHLQAFIDSGVSAGRYHDASEVVREGLRLLQSREKEERARLEWLRGAIDDAEDSLARGEGRSFGSIDEAADYIEALGRSASANAGERRR